MTRSLRPYLPIALVAALFTVMAITVDPVSRTTLQAAGSAQVPTAGIGA